MPSSPRPSTVVADDRVVEALRAAVRHPTVSHADPERVDPAPFEALLATLAEHFPRVHAELEVTRIPPHALLIRWAGTGGSASDAAGEGPVVLMAHLDVVPVDAEAPWTHPAFDAVLADAPEGPAIWGRGTLDDKGCAVAILAAVEALLEAGHAPRRDVWLSFGCDEEVSGTTAQAAVAALRERGVRPWFVIDEGGAIATGAFPGVRAPLGVVGVTEKGTTFVELRAEGRGGHASTPVRNGPTARIARALGRIDRTALPASLPAPTLELLRRLGPHLPLPLRPLLAASERLSPALSRLLTLAGPEAAAMVRTTLAMTTLSGSPAHNVIASTATAGINARVMVGDSVADVVAHLRRVIDDDGVEVRVIEAGEPSPVTPFSTPGSPDPAFGLLERTIGAVFPDAVPTPYVMMAATDARHFTALTERVYRFAPFRMSRAQREAIHSFDERITVDALHEGVAWYRRLLEEI